MVNSGTTGLATIQAGLNTNPIPLYRDWAVALFMDDLASGSNSAFQQKSWKYREIFSQDVSTTGIPYQLPVTTLADGLKSDFAVVGGSAGYARFATTAGKDALLTFTSGGGMPASSMQFVIIRTK